MAGISKSIVVVMRVLLKMSLVLRAIAGWCTVAGRGSGNRDLGFLNDHLDDFMAFGDVSSVDISIRLSWCVSRSGSDG